MRSIVATRLLKFADLVSFAAAFVAIGMILGLVVAMLYEVAARYAFNAPTIWAYDVSYMLNGALFVLAAALTLAKNNHVRIDFLSSRLSVPTQHLINAAFYVVLFLPALGFVTRSATIAAWSALTTGEVEAISPWAPVILPFNTAVAIGLAALWLQALAEAVRHGLGFLGSGAVRAPNVNLPH